MNLPPGIIKRVAEQIENFNNIHVNDDIVAKLETKIQHNNTVEQQRQKEIELQKAQEESDRAKTMVEEQRVPMPKPSKILELHASLVKD